MRGQGKRSCEWVICLAPGRKGTMVIPDPFIPALRADFRGGMGRPLPPAGLTPHLIGTPALVNITPPREKGQLLITVEASLFSPFTPLRVGSSAIPGHCPATPG